MKVKCIKRPPHTDLVVGQVYEVAREWEDYYDLVPQTGLQYPSGWFKSRFEVVQERKLLGYRVKTPDGSYVYYTASSLGSYPSSRQEKTEAQEKILAAELLYHWLRIGHDGRMVKVYRKAR